MAGKLGKFQHQTFTGWYSKVTKANHLGNIFQLQPQKATNMMVQLLALYRGKTLDTFLSQFPVKEFDSDDEYTWDVIGSSMRNIPLVEARDESGNVIEVSTDDSNPTPNVGLNGETFYLVFAEDWFPDGVVIVGELNEVYPIRVLGDGRPEGTNTVYRCECYGAAASMGIPAEQLVAGKRFSIEYAPVSKDLSRKVGGVHFANPISMRNEFTTIRIHDKVGGAMLNKKIAFGIPVFDEKSGSHTTMTMWMHYEQWQLEQEWSDYKNKVLAFGTSTRNLNGEYLNYDKSGEVIDRLVTMQLIAA